MWLKILVTAALGWLMPASTISFDRLPFVEAIRALEQRTKLSRSALERLQVKAPKIAAARTFELRAALIVDVWGAVARTMAAGGTVRDFLRTYPAIESHWTGETPYRGVFTFQQQSFMAYSAGQFDQFQEAGIEHWRFMTSGDELVCAICGRLDGRVFDMDDRRLWPGVHLGCRCQTEPVFTGERTRKTTSDQVFDEIARLRGKSGEEVRKIWERTLQRPGSFRWDPAEWSQQEVALVRIPPELEAVVRGLAERMGVEATFG